MNNTHIIIPIKDIEDRLSILKHLVLMYQDEKDIVEKEKIMIEIVTINETINRGKQISLNEEDINEQRELLKLAKKDFDSTETKFASQALEMLAYNDWIRGYKQALKDLL